MIKNELTVIALFLLGVVTFCVVTIDGPIVLRIAVSVGLIAIWASIAIKLKKELKKYFEKGHKDDGVSKEAVRDGNGTGE